MKREYREYTIDEIHQWMTSEATPTGHDIVRQLLGDIAKLKKQTIEQSIEDTLSEEEKRRLIALRLSLSLGISSMSLILLSATDFEKYITRGKVLEEIKNACPPVTAPEMPKQSPHKGWFK